MIHFTINFGLTWWEIILIVLLQFWSWFVMGMVKAALEDVKADREVKKRIKDAL